MRRDAHLLRAFFTLAITSSLSCTRLGVVRDGGPVDADRALDAALDAPLEASTRDDAAIVLETTIEDTLVDESTQVDVAHEHADDVMHTDAAPEHRDDASADTGPAALDADGGHVLFDVGTADTIVVDGPLFDAGPEASSAPDVLDEVDAATPTSCDATRVCFLSFALGSVHSCARVRTGTTEATMCWGAPDLQRLGIALQADAGVGPYNLTVRAGFDSRFDEIAAGSGFTCGRRGLDVYCWGQNEVGQTGRGSATPSEGLNAGGRIAIPRGGSDPQIERLVAGGATACVVLRTSGVRYLHCWGYGGSGQLLSSDYIPSGFQRYPVLIPGAAAPELMSMGDSHLCAMIGGRVQCWGGGLSSQNGSNPSMNSPSLIPIKTDMEVALAAEALSLGTAHSCAVARGSANEVHCWGSNEYGELNGIPAPSGRAHRAISVLLPAGEHAVKLAAGGHHTCALTASRRVYCWGSNLLAQLARAPGSEGGIDASGPLQVLLPSGCRPIDVAAGYNHSCAVCANGNGVCWGSNESGVLGLGGVRYVSTPVVIFDES